MLAYLPTHCPDRRSLLNNLDESCLAETISRNKVAVELGKRIEMDGVFKERFLAAFPRVKVLYQELNTKIARDSTAFSQMKDRFSEENIDFILIKSDGSFPYETDNIDVLIKPERLHEVAQLLENVGYSEVVQVREPHKFLFRKTRAHEELPLHIHTRVEWEGTQFINSYELWTRQKISEDCGGFLAPSPEDCILITAAHLFFENHEIKLADLLKIDSRIRNYDLDWNYMFNHVRKLHWDDAFLLTMLLANLVYKNLYGRNMLQQQVPARIEEVNNHWNHLFLKTIKPSSSEVIPLKIPYSIAVLFFLRRIIGDSSLSVTERLQRTAWIAYDVTKRRTR